MPYIQPSRCYILLLLLWLPFSAYSQVSGFTMPDTVCTNTAVRITNTSKGGSSWYWNFCTADLKQTPQAINLGNIGGVLSQPVFMDIVSQNGNYYGLMVNHHPGALVRLDFGNSMLNNPVATYLGNFGGVLNTNWGSEGIQVAKAGGKWTALIVGGNPASGSTPRLVKVDFGADITNPSPVATNWGNLGNTVQAIDFYLFSEAGNWHAYTVSAETNAIVRYDFGADFSRPPTAVNMGNPGNALHYPTGICPVNDGGIWRLFITNGSFPASLVRLDFGNSLLNKPRVVLLGNPQNVITAARSIRIIQRCDQVIGFVTDGSSNTLVRLDFNNDLTSIPNAVSLGNLANFSFPHSLSRLFRVGADLYTFIPNAHNNTLSRIRFEGCNSSSIPNSTAFNPPPVSYAQPGTYRVNLIMDDGLPGQSSFCRTITVLPLPAPAPDQHFNGCADSVVLRSRFPAYNVWSDGSTADSLVVRSSGVYSVSASYYGCSGKDNFSLSLLPLPGLRVNTTNALVCTGGKLQLSASGTDNYSWSPSAGLSDPSLPNPVASPAASTTYYVTSVGSNTCTKTDSVRVRVKPPETFGISPDHSSICTGDSVYLKVTGGEAAAGDHYTWLPVTGPSNPGPSLPLASQDPFSPVRVVSPKYTSTYKVIAYDNTCHLQTDLAAYVGVRQNPVTAVAKSNDIDCMFGEARLTATGGLRYSWHPGALLTDSTLASPVARTDTTTTYQVKITGSNGCEAFDSIRVVVSKTASIGFPLANAFTPNGDGANDCFGVKYWGYVASFEMNIFNRSGQQVFYTKNPGDCWDGTFRGRPQPAGAYICIIKAGTLCGPAVKQSTVMLIR